MHASAWVRIVWGESLCFHCPPPCFLSSFQLVSGLYASLSLLCHPSANLIPLPPSPSVHPSLCSSVFSIPPSVSSFFPLANLLLMHADFSVLGLTGVSFSRQPVTPPPPQPPALDPMAHPDPVSISWLLSISLLIPLPLNILLLCVPWHVLS